MSIDNAATGIPETPTTTPETPAANPAEAKEPETPQNGFFQPEAIEQTPEPAGEGAAAEPTADQTTTDDAAGDGKDATLSGFLGMDPATAKSALDVIAGGQQQQQQQPTPPTQTAPKPQPQGEQLTSDDIDEIINDLAMGDKAAAAFRKLARVNPAAVAAVAGQQPEAQPAQQAQPQMSAEEIGAVNTAIQSFEATLGRMGLTEQVIGNKVVGQAILHAADQIAKATGAKTADEFEKALNNALYRVMPDAVNKHFETQGQEKLKQQLQRRGGMMDATTQQTSSPSGGKRDLSIGEAVAAHRAGTLRQKLGV